MKRKNRKRLELAKKTLRRLDDAKLSEVNGGAPSISVSCPTRYTTTYDC